MPVHFIFRHENNHCMLAHLYAGDDKCPGQHGVREFQIGGPGRYLPKDLSARRY
jgi:hypothetical protein